MARIRPANILKAPASMVSGEGTVTAPDFFVEPAIYPLALIAPRQAGTAPTEIDDAPNFPTNHYSLFAYPGEPYYSYACAKDGALPYRYYLVDEPEGMTIDEDTGKIVWLNPTGSSVTFTVGVEDAEGTTRENEVTITVTTSGFAFLDAVNGDDSNNGSRDAPWRTLARLRTAGTSVRQAYVADGTYDTTGLTPGQATMGTGVVNNSGSPTTTNWWADGTTDLNGQVLIFYTGENAGHGALIEGGAVDGSRYHITSQHSAFPHPPQDGDEFAWGNTWKRVEWSAANHCVQWIARHGHAPVIDHDHVSFDMSWGTMHRLTGSSSTPVTVIGFKHINWLDKALQIGLSNYNTFADLYGGDDGATVNVDGSNPALVMFLTGLGSQSWFTYCRNILCQDSKVQSLKTYSLAHPVIESVDSLDLQTGSWDIKDDVSSFDVRYCKHVRAGTARYGGIYGNFANRSGGTFRFCLADTRGNPPSPFDEPIAFEYVQQGAAHGEEVWVVRCTLIGRVWAHDISNDNGPLHFRRCVIVNEDEGVFSQSVQSGRLDIEDNNLMGAPDDGIVDEDGLLQGNYRSEHGPLSAAPCGHELP